MWVSPLKQCIHGMVALLFQIRIFPCDFGFIFSQLPTLFISGLAERESPRSPPRAPRRQHRPTIPQ